MSPISLAAVHALGELALDIIAGDGAVTPRRSGSTGAKIFAPNKYFRAINSPTCGHAIIVSKIEPSPRPLAIVAVDVEHPNPDADPVGIPICDRP